VSRVVVATLRTRSAAETARLGEAIGRRMTGGATVCLNGLLGAGKTVLVQGLCRGLDVADDVVSPTFILLEVFAGRVPVIHIDLYRLEHERELEALGVFELPGTDTVLLAEWGARSPHLMEVADISLDVTADGAEARTIKVSARPELAGWFSELKW